MKEVTWTSFLLTLGGALAGVTVWAYSTFVTVRERDAMRSLYDQRLTIVEAGYSRLLEANAGLSAKMDTLIMLASPEQHGSRRPAGR